VLPRCSKEDEMAHGKDAAKWKRIVEGVSEVVRLMQTETLAMMEGRWEVMREAREAAAHEDAQERELIRAVDEVEREERKRRERQEQRERERDERVHAAAAEQERRAHLGNAHVAHRWRRRRVHHGERKLGHLAAIHRADHIMQVGQQYVDGRSGCSGAQFINTDLWEPRDDVDERYMVATAAEIRRRLAAGGRPTHVRWEVERASCAGDLGRGWGGRRRGDANSNGANSGRQ